jgi:hypothetical protein
MKLFKRGLLLLLVSVFRHGVCHHQQRHHDILEPGPDCPSRSPARGHGSQYAAA